jgi:23S rRNA (cytosine1962-C5)-methyltransferase
MTKDVKAHQRMQNQSVILKPGREKSLKRRHPWVFSGAIAAYPSFNDGDVLSVRASDGTFLGQGYFSRKSQIVGRMIAFDESPYREAITSSLKHAIHLREKFIKIEETNAFRLINAEQDCLPGLIVDKYADVLVMQVSTLGMEHLKPFITEELIRLVRPRAIYEKSTSGARREEGLSQFSGMLHGAVDSHISIYEGSVQLKVDIEGQKTGFFLDMREMRKLISTLSKGARVLNCFSYTGAFSLHALHGGASFCESVDISKDAITLSTELMQINNIATDRHKETVSDVFKYLKENDLNFDMVILDPPAFAKKKYDVSNAARGYKEINRLAIQKMPPHSLLLTCSCSYFVDEKLFEQIIFSAACDAGRDVRIVQKHRLAFDHPISVYHPEGSYLKSLLCYIV